MKTFKEVVVEAAAISHKSPWEDLVAFMDNIVPVGNNNPGLSDPIFYDFCGLRHLVLQKKRSRSSSLVYTAVLGQAVRMPLLRAAPCLVSICTPPQVL
jgi:hypothetical protein